MLAWLRRRRRFRVDLPPGMTEQDFHDLATYNGEIGRGLAHADDARKARMRRLQELWDAHHQQRHHPARPT